MKNYVLLVLLVVLFTSCSKNDSPPNTAPTIPSLINPANGKICISNTVTFEWTASTDIENNPIIYELELATDNLFNVIVKAVKGTELTQTVDLEKGKTYYWRVKAQGSNNPYSTSNIYSFLTESAVITNTLPFSPTLIAPKNNFLITGTSTTLKWLAFDNDVTDSFAYDLYFGTVNPPTTKIATNLAISTFDCPTLASNTNYYWYVVVKDNKGGQTKGQVWYFKTN